MKIIRSLSVAFAFLVPVTAIASPVVRAEAACCPGDCCPGDCCPGDCCPGDCCEDCPFCPS